MIIDEIPLERGLCFFYEMEEEFRKKALPIEKQIAIAFEAGRHLGQSEVKRGRDDKQQKD